MEDPYRLAASMLEAVGFAERDSEEAGLANLPREDGFVVEALAFAAAAAGARLFVDLGAGAGVSSVWVALGASRGCIGECRLVLVDRDAGVLQRAERNVRRAVGGSIRVETVASDALEYLESVERVDFVMVDVEKSAYPAILDALRGKLGHLAVFPNALYPPPPRSFYEKLQAWRWTLIPTSLGLVVAKPG